MQVLDALSGDKADNKCWNSLRHKMEEVGGEPVAPVEHGVWRGDDRLTGGIRKLQHKQRSVWNSTVWEKRKREDI